MTVDLFVVIPLVFVGAVAFLVLLFMLPDIIFDIRLNHDIREARKRRHGKHERRS